MQPLTISNAFKEIKAAHFWNLKPWEFRVLTRDQKAELVAAFIVDREIEGYYASEMHKKAKKK